MAVLGKSGGGGLSAVTRDKHSKRRWPAVPWSYAASVSGGARERRRERSVDSHTRVFYETRLIPTHTHTHTTCVFVACVRVFKLSRNRARPIVRCDDAARLPPMVRDARCQGTVDQLTLAVGVMSRPLNADQRAAVRRGWGHDDTSVLACFVVGTMLKVNTSQPHGHQLEKKQLDKAKDVIPRGQLSPLPELESLKKERAELGDLLLLDDTAEIDSARAHQA